MATYSSEPYYKLVSSISENAEDLKKEVRKSKVQLEMDFETGDFKGRYIDTDFHGNYIIEHTSAGFAKGFYYRVSLGGLSKGLSTSAEEEAFFEQLIRCKKISVMPDKLANPSYIRIELSDNDQKIQLVKFIKPLE
jgi:hypothetical protein